MDYWKTKYKGKDVTLGDTSMDIMIEAINGIIGIYKMEFGRKPTLEEIKAIFEENVKGYGTDWHSIEEKTEQQMAMYEECSQADGLSENIAQSISEFTGKEVKPEEIRHFKLRNKSRDN